MNTKTPFTSSMTFLILSLLILIPACKNDDEVPDNNLPEFYVEGPIMPCPSQAIDLSEVSFQINEAYEYENLIVAGGFDNMAIFNSTTNELVEIDTIGVNQFLEYQGKLMICAWEGLYSLDAEQNIVLESRVRCNSLLLSASGNLLMGTADDQKILDWNPTQGLTEYTDDNATSFVGLTNLIELNNGEIWAIGGDQIATYKDQLFQDIYDSENISINEGFLRNDAFISPYKEGAILVAKNGLGYQILKFTDDQEWVLLFDGDLAPRTDESLTIRQPSITGMIIRDDKLYVSTTIAGCKGFQVFEITKNEFLTPDDYYPQFDNNFEAHCISGLDYAANGDVITISYNSVLIYNCN